MSIQERPENQTGLENKKHKQIGFLNRWRTITLGAVAAVVTAFPVRAAEKIMIDYGPLQFSISVAALATYAESGRIEPELKFYLNFLNAEDRGKFRDFLQSRFDISHVQVYRLLNTPMGENLLEYFGSMFQIPGGINGALAIRGSAILAASESKQLTPIDFLQKFPTDIQLNTKRIRAVVRRVSAMLEQTKTLVTALEDINLQRSTLELPTDFEQLIDIRQPGSLDYTLKTLTLEDQERSRKVVTDIYYPQNISQAQTKLPIIVASHGLGSNRDKFAMFAQHLASYGFAVVLPQHSGSDSQQKQALMKGLSREVFVVEEFFDRPLDVSFILDELEKQNQKAFHGKLNLQQVGAIGHSFGSYTALALAGAEINFEGLENDCQQLDALNISLLLQCRALELPRQAYSLKDERVKAIFLTNAVNSSIFGQAGLSQLNIPVFWVMSSADRITPVALEQIYSFTWLTNTEKYLGMIENAHHADLNFSFASAKSESPAKISESSIIQDYLDAFGLAFFQVYIANQPEYNLYLRSSYAQAISQKSYPLSLLSPRIIENL